MNISKEQLDTIKQFMDWFEDNLGDEEFLDDATEEELAEEEESDQIWRPYNELPEFVEVLKVIEEVEQS